MNKNTKSFLVIKTQISNYYLLLPEYQLCHSKILLKKKFKNNSHIITENWLVR